MDLGICDVQQDVDRSIYSSCIKPSTVDQSLLQWNLIKFTGLRSSGRLVEIKHIRMKELGYSSNKITNELYIFYGHAFTVHKKNR